VALVSLAFQIRSQWLGYKTRTPRQRELAAEANRSRRVWQRIFMGGMVVLALLLFLLMQSGNGGVQHYLQVAGRYLMWFLSGGVGLLIVLYFALYWLQRDQHIVHAAKLALAGKHEEARVYLEGVIGSDGPTRDRLNALGLLFLDQKRPQEALEQFDLALKTFGENPALRNNRAMALKRLDRLPEALHELEQLTGPDCKDVVTLCNYAVLLAEAGRETEGYEQLRRAELICAGYDPRMLPKPWTVSLQEARSKLPLTEGFPVKQAATPVNVISPSEGLNR
jgi:tetratricopeptide (TPR) repeat protein